MKPIIAITLNHKKEDESSNYSQCTLREHYFNAVFKAGGTAISIPYIKESISDYLDLVDGVIVPGGDFAYPDEWYDDPNVEKPYSYSKRVNFDIAIIEEIIKRDIPFLGICAGMQTLGGVLGCKLQANIGKSLNSDINHRSESCEDIEKCTHNVKIKSGSLLEKIIGQNALDTNSIHKEGFIEINDKVIASAIAEDGAIECIEMPNKKHIIGVQWHPEFLIEEGSLHLKLFESLVNAAKKD